MLIATALNLLTTRTKINTVICLQTRTAELFLHSGSETPSALRMRLSSVFTRLRGQASSNAGDRVERLLRLSELREQGLLSPDEFETLKRDLLPERR